RNRHRDGAMCPRMAQETGMQAQTDVTPPATALPADGTAIASNRALVPIHSAVSNRCLARSRYPAATFLAHLIAVDRRLPQTRAAARAWGRAPPAEAAPLYSALSAKRVRTGRRVRRQA